MCSEGAPDAEIGLAVCVCGHGRSEHVYCDEDYPALCQHAYEPKDAYDWGVCMCLNFEPWEAA